MHLGRERRHRILDGDDRIIVREGIANGGFDTEIGGDAGENHGLDAAAAQLEVDFSPVKGAPLMLGDAHIGRERRDLKRLAQGFGRQSTLWEDNRLVSRLVDSIGIVCGKSDGHENRGAAGGFQRVGDCGGIFDCLLGGMGRDRPGNDEALQIDGDQGRGLGIVEGHGRLQNRYEDILTIESMRMPSQKSSLDLTKRSPKQKRGWERVAVLTEAAARVFLDKGYEAATMTEIAAEAKSSIGSLYQFFPTKVLLAEALHLERLRQLNAALVDLQ